MDKLGIVLLTVGAVLTFFVIFGYAKNLVRLIQLDFNAPYKAEIIRGGGVLFPPLGVIAGYTNIQDQLLEDNKE